jgi:hypothetical protein
MGRIPRAGLVHRANRSLIVGPDALAAPPVSHRSLYVGPACQGAPPPNPLPYSRACAAIAGNPPLSCPIALT